MTDDDLPARVRSLWTELAGAPVEFSPSGGVDVVVAPGSRMCTPGWTGIVSLGGAVVVTAPDTRRAGLMRSAARRLTAAQLLDPARLSAAVPVLDALGPASLLYLGRDDFAPAHRAAGVRQLPADDRRVATLLAETDRPEAEESGLGDITSPAFVVHVDNRPTAAAGYRCWPRSVAHMSVLVARPCRGRGLARVCASAAVSHALDAGLMPQWRARPYRSRRVALALGFCALGQQLGVRVG